jgi:hypothetical protein
VAQETSTVNLAPQNRSR